jgi:hypothetical protein
MPHANLRLIPGVDQNRTEALNEAAIWESNLIRFVPDRQGQGLPQKLGGWDKFLATPIWNDTVNSLHAWSDTSSRRHLAIGTNNSIWQSTDQSTANDIAPQYYTTDLPVSITTTSGSAEVIVGDVGSNISSYDSVYFKIPISVNGIILSGLYSCKQNPLGPASSYIVTATNIIGVPTPAVNLFSVTTISAVGAGPATVTVVYSSTQVVPVGASVTFTGAGSYAGPYTVLTSAAGTFTFSTPTNLGSASTGTFVPSQATGGAVPTLTSTVAPTTPTITVTLENHGYSVGSTFSAQVLTPVGGVDIYGDYIVTSVPSANTFTIAAGSAPTSAVAVSMNGSESRVVYYIGQQGLPATGYGASGYGYFGYGNNVDPASAVGRQYAGTTVVTVGTETTVTLTGIWVNIPVGTIVRDTAVAPASFTVTSSTHDTNSTFTFTGTPTGTTFNVSQWGFVMPGADPVDDDPALFDPDWGLDNWGEYLVASPHLGSIFFWQPAQNNGRLTIMPNAPAINEGLFTAMPERQIVAYGSTFTGFQDPMLIRWCDVGNFTNWVGTVVNQAGSYRIPKGSKIVGGIQGPQQGLLWTDLALWSMQYINLPLVYSFNEIASGCGLIGRKAMGTMAGNVYWMSQSQFFKLSGNGVEPINCPVWDVVFQDIDQDPESLQKIRCAPNSRFGEISWYYPTIGSNGIPTKYVKYNTLLNQWDYGTMTRTAWIDQSVNGPPIGASLEIDPITTLPFYNIYQHETSENANGLAMNSYFQTGYFAIQEGDLKTFLDQVWPDMKWGLYDQGQGATVTITFYTADYPSDTPQTYAFTVTQGTQFVTPRFRARLVSIKVESNDLNSFWRLGNIRYRYQPDGKF